MPVFRKCLRSEERTTLVKFKRRSPVSAISVNIMARSPEGFSESYSVRSLPTRSPVPRFISDREKNPPKNFTEVNFTLHENLRWRTGGGRCHFRRISERPVIADLPILCLSVRYKARVNTFETSRKLVSLLY